MIALSLVLLLAAAAPQDQSDVKKIPRGSVEIVTHGCLEGRAFTAVQPAEADVRRGPNVTGRSFRVAAKKDVMKDVKKYNHQLVEVVGLVQESALSQRGLGGRIGNTRVTIGGPRTADPMTNPARTPVASVIVMDVTSVRFVADSCPIVGK